MGAIYLGSNQLGSNAIYLGANNPTAIFVGSTLVWPSGA